VWHVVPAAEEASGVVSGPSYRAPRTSETGHGAPSASAPEWGPRGSGGKFGREVKLGPDRLAHARKMIDHSTTPTDAAKVIGIGRATLYRALQREAA